MKYFEFKKPLHENYPNECQRIWDYLNDIGKPNFCRSSVEDLWRDFSDEKYSAGFMGVDYDTLDNFAEWLSEKEI